MPTTKRRLEIEPDTQSDGPVRVEQPSPSEALGPREFLARMAALGRA